jgi:hypothetical protein
VRQRPFSKGVVPKVWLTSTIAISLFVLNRYQDVSGAFMEICQGGSRFRIRAFNPKNHFKLKGETFHHRAGFFFGEVFPCSTIRASNQAKSCFHCA